MVVPHPQVVRDVRGNDAFSTAPGLRPKWVSQAAMACTQDALGLFTR